jgi:hypothetical protein
MPEAPRISRRVVEPPALEPLGSVGPQATIVGTDGKNDEAGLYLLTVSKHQLPQPIALGHREATASVSAGDDGAELPRLQRRPLGQV